jgi:2-polyprenyl-3-methyl-5-hydroxy-6-metoxy-1,4-benzoquinol methylase
MKSSRPCPICDFGKAKEIRKINFTLFDKHPMNNGYILVQCEKCGFVYADTSVSQTELDDYYENLSKYEDKTISTGGGYTIHDKNRLTSVAKYISSKFDNKEIEIVDIGCAIGGLLEQLRNEGFSNLTGIDPSISCVEITKSEKKCKCYHSSLFNIQESFGKYDLVILSHVWEHILDLKSAIKSIEKILKPNGYIYIECPNAMLYNEIIHAPFQEFNTEHINHFTEQSFINYFGNYGYKFIEIGNKIHQIASGQDYNSVYGLFSKEESISTFELTYENLILDSINKYLNNSDIWFNKIIEKIKKQVNEYDDIVFFGIGQFAFKLLFIIKDLNFRGSILLFDSNKLNVGKKILTTYIMDATDIVNVLNPKNSKIIISSLIYQNEIKEELNMKFKETNLESPQIIELDN